jgi:hypothetical protein
VQSNRACKAIIIKVFVLYKMISKLRDADNSSCKTKALAQTCSTMIRRDGLGAIDRTVALRAGGTFRAGFRI